jgi:hypothetical protein
MIVNLEVKPVHFRRELIGYCVAGVHRACSDSLWEPVAHEAIFRTQARAERFLAKIKAPGRSIAWAHWGVPFGHRTSPIDAFDHQPAHYSVL